MPDRLYLSYWLRGFTEHNMLRHFAVMLGKFPFSRLSPRAAVRIYALEEIEPPVIERDFAGLLDLDEVIRTMREFQNRDCAFHLETFWDIWQFETDWKLQSAPVTLSCYAPLFPSELGEQLRIDFGLDANFLPRPDVPAGLTTIRHNIRGLLHLVRDLDASFPVDKRLLWSESGGNFAERLEAALSGDLG
jgi:hypothetical protein